MKKQPTRLNKIFGSGPKGAIVSLVLFCVAYGLNRQLDIPPITSNQCLLNIIFFISCPVGLLIFVWSFLSLPAADRGNKLCVAGAYKYVRHPLYAAFLSVFNFGLALYLNSYLFILWAICLHPIWHYVVRGEEQLMIDVFGNDYLEYQKKTGRFFPKLTIKRE